MEPLLQVKDLRTSFFTHYGEVQALRGVSFSVYPQEVVGVIGESGCGKSVTALSIMRLLASQGRIKSGEVLFKGQDLLKLSSKEMAKLRGRKISMVFQDSMASLNPVFTVGAQMEDLLRYHTHMTKAQAKERTKELLGLVGISEPEKRMNDYPHQLSGGQRQRIMIAMALSSEPELLLADEPTTALDVTIQAQILRLIRDLTEKLSTAVVLITHDLGVIANMCSRVVVMYGGQVMEQGSVQEIFDHPLHPYTQGLLKTILDLDTKGQEELFCMDGLPPSLLNPPKGCPFARRCPRAMKICGEQSPEFFGSQSHNARCHLLDEACPVKGGNVW